MKRFLAMAALGAFLSTPALAQSKGARPYVGGAVGVAMSDVAQDFGQAYYSRVSRSDDSTTGYKLYGGVLWGYWGVEVGYYDFGQFEVEGGLNNSVGDRFGTTAFAVSAVGYWPVARDLSLSAKLGLAPTTTKYECMKGCTGISNTDNTSTGVLFSLGLGWHLSPNVTLTAAWDALGGAKAVGYSGPGRQEEATYSYHMLSLGVEARF